jgi:type III secretory pathway component EscT
VREYIIGFVAGVAFTLCLWGVSAVVSHIADLDHEVVKIETFLSHAQQ